LSTQSNEPPILRRLTAVLLDTRRELIDLSRRNRLLHTPRTGKRPHCLEIIDTDPNELFVGLVRDGKQFGFGHLPEGELTPREPERAASSRIQRLQTNLVEESLNRRLLKFFREARTFEEEQGVNILFIVLGFLNWYEDPKSDEICSAPLVLVPVALERRQGRDMFVMRGRDDDMIVNVSLSEKLRGLGVILPDLPDNDEWLPTAYFDAVSAAVAAQTRWRVDRTAVGLGFFTFSKFLMWRDLDPAVWPDPNKLLGNELVAQLLGEGEPADPLPPLVDGDDPIDEHIDLAAAIHVLNADSSQAVCIEEARRGHNLVVQGPPGTGKSQTIANVIAAATCGGKSVLFVAEKAAALDVVYGRLKAVGLEPLCLELHSRKATKASVVASLEKSIRAGSATQIDGRVTTELRKARDLLNVWSRKLHQKIRKSGRTPYQVIGSILNLHPDQVRAFEHRLDIAADWDEEKLREVDRTVDRVVSAVRELGVVPLHHSWYGTYGKRLTPFDADRLRATLEGALKCAIELEALAVRSANVLEIDGECSCAALANRATALHILANAPPNHCEVLASPRWHSDRIRIAKLIECGKLWSSCNAEIGSQVTSAAWDYNLELARQVIAAHGGSLFRFAIGRYRRAIADLRAICQPPPPRTLSDRLRLLEKVISAQIARREIQAEQDLGNEMLGPLWLSESTSWDEVEKLFAWAGEAEQRAPQFRLRELAASADRILCAAVATKLDTALTAFRAALFKVTEIIQIDPNAVFSATSVDDVPLRSLVHTIEKWVTAVPAFNDWVAAEEGFANLSNLGMAFISDGLKCGDIGPSETKPMVQLLIAEALWRAALADDPALDEIDGRRRSETVYDFRALDRRRIELARLEVLARYFERKPSGAAGEMAIVRAEIGKKRRHLPVRKLMETAGFAIQRLKPIFLMSPLSVAQFLPPGRFAFDLVVIDEASQVPPEEALGAIARARQMVVVGDDKQLPPTNFFRMLSDNDDEDAEATPVLPGRPRNFESILTLARARGTAERMLRWHYRSKHPSLIAISNHSCYAGALLLPPSPLIKSDQFGLSVVKTPPGHYERGGSGRNPVEAERIVAAIEQHIVKHPERSLGVACFSVAQRDAIEDAIQARGLLGAAEQFSPNGERLFVKNLEAVQGDERDVIFISIGYGTDAQGRMTAGFGPLSTEGGERRLNVLISRARLQCVVFSSISAGDIPVDVKARGAKMLREFLHFAETGHIAAGEMRAAEFDSPFEEAVAKRIGSAGYNFVPQVGVAGFRVDLGILHPKQRGRFVLGVECDGATYHSGRSARDRDRLRQEVLESLGWRLYRIWSTDWFRNPTRETEKLLSAIEHACEAGVSDNAPRQDIEPAIQNTDQIKAGAVDAEPKRESSIDVPAATPYRECDLRVPRGADLFSYNRDALSELAVSVVRAEGPIHVEEVARRIRGAFGLERTGRRILSRVDTALKRAARRGVLERVGEFWVVNGARPNAPRSRRDVSSPLRRPDRIAPMEYRLAIKTVLQSCVAATRSELVVGVARLLGFDRTGNGIDQAISNEIESMVEGGVLNDTGGRMTLPPGTQRDRS